MMPFGEMFFESFFVHFPMHYQGVFLEKPPSNSPRLQGSLGRGVIPNTSFGNALRQDLFNFEAY